MPSSAVTTFTDPDDYYGGAYGSYDGTYYDGTAVVTPSYPGWARLPRSVRRRLPRSLPRLPTPMPRRPTITIRRPITDRQ